MSIHDSIDYYESKKHQDELKRAREDHLKIVECLKVNVPEEYKEVFRRNVLANPFWVIEQHLGYGMYIRNLLRKKRFVYDDFVMDDLWIEWASEALL